MVPPRLDELDCGDRSRFSLESLQQPGHRRDVGRKNLDRDSAVQTRVPGPVHLAHGAGTGKRLNLIRT
jgi:hypothetical protein